MITIFRDQVCWQLNFMCKKSTSLNQFSTFLHVGPRGVVRKVQKWPVLGVWQIGFSRIKAEFTKEIDENIFENPFETHFHCWAQVTTFGGRFRAHFPLGKRCFLGLRKVWFSLDTPDFGIFWKYFSGSSERAALEAAPRRGPKCRRCSAIGVATSKRQWQGEKLQIAAVVKGIFNKIIENWTAADGQSHTRAYARTRIMRARKRGAGAGPRKGDRLSEA